MNNIKSILSACIMLNCVWTYATANDTINDNIIVDSMAEILYPEPVIISMSTNLIPSAQNNTPPKTQISFSPERIKATVDKQLPMGMIDVTSGNTRTGAKTYTVPVKVAPGINEAMTPKIAFSYNSQQGNGTLGKGWALSGLSSITRATASVYYDDWTRGVSLSSNDVFYIDGVRLIKSNGNESSATYISELGHIKAIAQISNGDISYFNVYYPDGKKGIFGFQQNSGSKLTFPLTRLTDKRGNYIEYQYSRDNSPLIEKIKYNGNTIEFIYKTRSDNTESYRGGVRAELNSLLSDIKCYSNGNEIGVYSLSYTSSVTKSLLNTIGYSCGNSSLNPLRFYYGDDSSASNIMSKNSQSYLSRSYKKGKLVKGRFDQENNSDGLIVSPSSNPYYPAKTSYGYPAYANLYDTDSPIFVYSDLTSQVADPLSTLVTGKGFIDIVCADLTGDQNEEIIKINSFIDADNYENIVFSVYMPVALGLIKKYERTHLISTPTVSGTVKTVHPKFYHTGDFDGDGRMEILAVSADKPFGKNSLASECFIFELEEGSIRCKEECLKFEYSFTNENNNDKFFVIDYNGDGKSDICHINSNGTDIYSVEQGYFGDLTISKVASYSSLKRADLKDRMVFPCDINGDGMTDLLVTPINDSQSTVWTIHEGMGNGLFTKFSLTGPRNQTKDENYGFVLQDVNSDGLADLVSYGYSLSNIFLCNGNGFKSTPDIKLYYSDAVNPQIVPTSLSSRNRFSQLLVYSADDSSCSLTAYGCSVNESLQSLCTGMTNSLGVTETNTYAFATDRSSGICDAGTGAVYPYVNIYEPMPLLAEVTTSVNGTDISSEKIHYENPVLHRQGLGFQGFEKVTRTDYKGQVYSQTYDIYKRGTLLVDVSPTDSIEYDIDIRKSSNRQLMILPIKTKVRNILDGITTTTTMAYDSFGNMTGKTTTYPDNATATETYSYSNNDTPGDEYCIGLPLSSTKTIKSGSETFSESTSVTSYDRGLPLSKRTMRNGLQLNEKTFEYYDNGLIKSVAEKAYSSSKIFKTSNEYDSNGRISKTTDSFGHSTSYTYYTENGLVKTIVDKTGTTEMRYDAFGREVYRKDPVNPQITTAYEWDSYRASGHYMVTVNTNGTPSVTHFDPLNRNIEQVEMRIDGKKSSVSTEYDKYGNVKSVSYPHNAENAATLKTEFTYDIYGRKTSESSPSGKSNTYSYGKLQSTETVNGIETVRTFDCRGNLIKVSDPSGTVTYELALDGQPKKIVAPGGAVTTFVYDNYRRLTSRNDPSNGTETFTYDSDGNVKSTTNARGQSTSYTYDAHNRITSMTMPEMTVNYTYDSATGYLTSVSSSNGFKRTLVYDKPGRVTQSKESFDGKSIQSNYSYGAGLLRQAVHKSSTGFSVKENYGYSWNQPISVILNDTITVYEKLKVNDFGQVTESSCAGITTTYTYDEYGALTGRQDKWGRNIISDVSLDFDPYNGNLLSRTDNRRGITEQFEYDGLNRLTDYGDNHVGYASNGNITSKSDAGMFAYGNTSKPYALTHAVFADPDIPTRDQNITYASFMRPLTLSENDYGATFTYGPEFDRIKMVLDYCSSWGLKRYYLGGNYEFDNNNMMQISKPVGPGEDIGPLPGIPIDTYGTDGIRDPLNPGTGDVKREDFYDVERIYIGGDAYTAHAVMVKSTKGGGSTVLYRIVRDHVGSIVALVGDGGKIVEENSYDAWGRMRDPDTHEVYLMDKVPGLTLGRGYGSHEYLHRFGLVNMNARLYDPVLGRFASPDPYVQDPTLPQNFNRYSYCLNNPLLYCDQSGEWFGIDDLFIAAVGFVTGYLSNAITTGNWGWSSVKSGLIGAGMCWLGYNTAGLATGVINGETLNQAASIGLSALTSNIMPPFTFNIGGVTIGISVNPLIGLGTGGFTYGAGLNVLASYKKLRIGCGFGGGGYGFGDSNSSSYLGWNASATVDGYGSGYGKTYYGEYVSPNGQPLGKQTLGTIHAYLDEVSIAFSNDFLGDGEDRWHSNAVEISWREFSIGTFVDTNDGKNDSNGIVKSKDDESPNLGPNRNNKGAWLVGNVHFAPLWMGYRRGNSQYRLGYSHTNIQDYTQNFIHKYIAKTNYFIDYDKFRRGGYFYGGSINPFDLWHY